MTDPFEDRVLSLNGPATDIVPVTPSDTVNLGRVAVALYVETGGALSLVTQAGETRSVTVADNSFLPVAVRRVNASGTAAVGIHALMVG
ncbi:spike base protein, RCAP_Rcc01079 family [Thalassorhabdomicrobium marinisediminis]|uniref:Uncharacterized protein n=1 Tax=Thalassorhabdomicrobium marinisediminis TaxID=2170577 RepID=A0A2T7G162_9RHOB|nr:hypothetical protein [Thalassorhabdomicrobium marinisediminis]PVA08155.1 hypothetical protein DC363_01260 [Thalassorhabdomicrobium marinisediminis]